MYKLACPHCPESIVVTPARAGGEAPCQACGQNLPVPKLGELRSLPRADVESQDATHAATQRETSLLFPILALIGFGLILAGGFCAIRWAFISISATTDQHIEIITDSYRQMNGSELLGELEDMETRDIQAVGIHTYVKELQIKAGWGRTSLVCSALGAISLIAGFAIGRRKTTG